MTPIQAIANHLEKLGKTLTNAAAEVEQLRREAQSLAGGLARLNEFTGAEAMQRRLDAQDMQIQALTHGLEQHKKGVDF